MSGSPTTGRWAEPTSAGTSHDHFDRLVHFTYGFCLAGILHRHLGRWRSLEVVISTSAPCELLE